MSSVRQPATKPFGRAEKRPAGRIESRPANIEAILRCPITGQPLERLTSIEVHELNSRAVRGELFHSDGTSVRAPVESAYATTDREYAYAVREDITMMLPSLAIVLRENVPSSGEMRREKKNVQDFYEKIGWSRDGGQDFEDARKYEDLRAVA